jgi:threonine synthase
MRGIADDGGLYMPLQIPHQSISFIQSLKAFTFQELAYHLVQQYIDDISKSKLQEITEKTFNFDVPVIRMAADISILELFHGPTLAFKDFGARFLANIMAHYMESENKELIVLVATSGDTGSAVAHAFYEFAGIKVFLLYPSKKVSWIQEQQLTTMNENIYAFEVEGTFDDCQYLVKTAFLDEDLREKFSLSSANSINIARLLPQSLYYFSAYTQLDDCSNPIIFVVPSGNFGNLTAGLIAQRMGLPVDLFIAAVNSNKIFPQYLKTGKFEPKAAVKTLSNAMDVGNPSNFKRLVELYDGNIEKIRNNIYSCSISDQQTVTAIKDVYQKYNYVIDPHGAVGFQAMQEYAKSSKHDNKYMILETAHPAKFYDIVKEILNIEVKIPQRLATALSKNKNSITISKNFNDFKSSILDRF